MDCAVVGDLDSGDVDCGCPHVFFCGGGDIASSIIDDSRWYCYDCGLCCCDWDGDECSFHNDIAVSCVDDIFLINLGCIQTENR